MTTNPRPKVPGEGERGNNESLAQCIEWAHWTASKIVGHIENGESPPTPSVPCWHEFARVLRRLASECEARAAEVDRLTRERDRYARALHALSHDDAQYGLACFCGERDDQHTDRCKVARSELDYVDRAALSRAAAEVTTEPKGA